MAASKPVVIKLEVEVIDNGFLLIKNRTDDYPGKRVYCKDEDALANMMDTLMRMWAKMELKKKQKQ